MNQNLILGDCLDKLKDLPDNSVDSIVTDPPAGIEFMGKEWDSFKNNERSKGWSCHDKDGGEGFGGFGKSLKPSFYNQSPNEPEETFELNALDLL